MRPIEEISVLLDGEDNVAVLRSTLKAGSEVRIGGERVVCPATIPAGHKVALRHVPAQGELVKYGQVIGFAREDIAPGEHVHTRNVSCRDFERRCDPLRTAAGPPREGAEGRRTFMGYARPGRRAGTRNYVAVIASVNCSASAARHVAGRFGAAALEREFPRVDGVAAFTHPSGCSILPGSPLELLQRTLAGIARHPNVGGCVFLGLGCEVNQLSRLFQAQELDPGSIPALSIQRQGGMARTVEAAAEAVGRILPRADEARRTPQGADQLALALNCGGSDGHSGITANPALGHASDLLVAQGGTSVLAETPEIYGAEHLLARRARDPEVARRLMERIRWWEDHVRLHGASIDNNPSFGNHEGGLTTIYEKSLGAVAKAGAAPLEAVYRYAEPVESRGLCFMDTPGNDPVSMTGLVGGGCNIAAFTTGRGSVYGCKPAPCLKIASHTPLYRWMDQDMDINAGTILDGEESVPEAGRRIFEALLAVAGGERTCSERAGMGDEEFVPWHLGPVL